MLLLITAACAERDFRRGERSRTVCLLMLFGVLVTGLTAHVGGLMSRGADFFAY
jgi:hypothetical protein